MLPDDIAEQVLRGMLGADRCAFLTRRWADAFTDCCTHLVGGTSGYMYGNQISDLFGTGFPDWQTGSVLSLFLLVVIAALTVVFGRFNQASQAASG